MGQEYLIDTNVLIDFYGGKLPNNAIALINECLSTSFNISVIVKIETLGFSGPSADMQGLKALLSFARILYINDDVADLTIQIRKDIKKIHLGDAIIAATALSNNYTLLSRNTKDFKAIEGLTTIDPYNF